MVDQELSSRLSLLKLVWDSNNLFGPESNYEKIKEHGLSRID